MFTELVLILSVQLIHGQHVELDISTGRLLGLRTRTVPKGTEYYSFRGIRYAETPGRFEPSVPKSPWEGVYDATQDQSICIQAGFNQVNASEDCLFINVYSPSLPSDNNTLLPVMFWIYGGGFIFGNSQSTTYSPDYFMDDGVIIATINYRLGIFGFLSTGDEVVPGNNGLKDIILGLQWVQDNIRYFNGDPTKVTIFGQSAGGALTSYLTLSPLTRNKGYFAREISQSGNALSPWALQRNPRGNYRQALTKSACRILEPFGLGLYCLRHISTNAVIAIETAIIGVNAGKGLNILNGIAFSPCYEVNSTEAALVNGSYSLLEQGSIPTVPFIMGITSEEGFGIQEALPIIRLLLLQADLFKSLLVPVDMYASDADKRDHIISAIWDYYFNGNSTLQSSDENIIRYISDALFNKPFRQYLTLVGNRVPFYCYQFSYIGNPSRNHSGQNGSGGVGHAEELPYLWRNNNNITLSPQDLTVKDKMVRLWTNFAKYGNPTPDMDDQLLEDFVWEQGFRNGTNVSCLNVETNLEVIENPKQSGYMMWYNLYESYGHPNDTY